MKDIEKYWNEFLEKPFPEGSGGVEVEGIELASLDTYSAGCINTFITNKGHLDPSRISILKKCANELDIVVRHLNGEAKTYFELLQLLAKQVLNSVS